jgi:hypothetical protein
MVNKLMFFLIFLTTIVVNAQSKKDIKENNVKGITSYNYVTKLGKTTKIKDNYKEYNNKGLLIKHIEYNKEGKLKETFNYYYDSNDNKIKEEFFNEFNKLQTTTIYTHKNGLKTSKIVKNAEGAVISKKEYEITFY